MNYIITMKDIKKIEILQQVIDKKIKGYEAASLLGYSQVHISRLKQKVIKSGFESILRARRPSPGKRKKVYRRRRRMPKAGMLIQNM